MTLSNLPQFLQGERGETEEELSALQNEVKAIATRPVRAKRRHGSLRVDVTGPRCVA